MNWLQRLFRKESPIRSAISIRSIGRAQPFEGNFRNFADEGMKKNAIVYTCISGIAERAAGIPWVLFKRQTNGKKVKIDKHPLLDLLRRPNPLQDEFAFKESMMGYALIGGEMFCERIVTNVLKTRVKQLWPQSPEFLNVVPGKKGIPQKYETNTRPKVTYSVDQMTGESDILHYKKFNPTDLWRGLSPIKAAALAVSQHNEASVHNLSLLKNQARPSGALMVKTTEMNQGGVLQDDERLKLKEELTTVFSGSKNAGRPMLLEGGLEWTSFSMTNDELNWLEGKNISAKDIALVFNYPPALLGVKGDSTFNNLEAAKVGLYDDAVIPGLQVLRNSLFKWLMNFYEDDLILDFDLDTVETLIERRMKRYVSLNPVTFLTSNDKQAATGFDDYKPTENPGDQLFIQASQVPIEFAAEPLETGADDDPDDTEANNSSEDDEDAEEDEKSFDVKQALTRLENDITRWLDRHAGRKIQNITRTTRSKIRKALSEVLKESVIEGDSLAQTSKKLDKQIFSLYSGFSKGRVRTIARTEVASASTNGSRLAAKASKIPNLQKEWIPSQDDRSRDGHIAMSGVAVGLNDQFEVGSADGIDLMDGPHDANAPADQVINCRCVLGFLTAGKVLNLSSARAKRAFWMKTNRNRMVLTRNFAQELNRFFRAESKEMRNAVAELDTFENLDNVIDDVLDEQKDKMRDVYIKNLRSILTVFGTEVLDALEV